MSVDRANLSGGPAKVTWNGGTFFAREEITARHDPEWKPVHCDAHGDVDQSAVNVVLKQTFRLWGAWENLSILFPSSVLTPSIGADIYGTTDLPLVIHARNQDRITYANAQLTKLSNLFLGVNDESFSADLEFTALIGNNKNPEDAGAYFVADTSAYADATFAKTNYKQQRFAAAWTGTGFTAFQAQKGWAIDWNLELTPRNVDAVGTVGFKIKGFTGTAKCIPLTPSIANMVTASNIQPGDAAIAKGLGRLLSAVSADLVLTGAVSQTVTLKNAGMSKSGFVFGAEPERQGECEWMTTVGFSAGTAAARAVIA